MFVIDYFTSRFTNASRLFQGLVGAAKSQRGPWNCDIYEVSSTPRAPSACQRRNSACALGPSLSSSSKRLHLSDEDPQVAREIFKAAESGWSTR